MKKYVFSLLILVVFLISGCSQEITLEERTFQEDTNEKTERIDQVEELLDKLNEQYDSDKDLIRSTFESSYDSLMADCNDSGTFSDICFDQVDTLIDISELVESNHIGLRSMLTDDLLYYGQYTQEDLQDIYQEASDDLAKDTEEGIKKIKRLSFFKIE